MEKALKVLTIVAGILTATCEIIKQVNAFEETKEKKKISSSEKEDTKEE